jgi:DNA-binding transcriptional LysR family regulator
LTRTTALPTVSATPDPASIKHPPLPYSRFDMRLLEAVANGSNLADMARRLRLRSGAVERHLDRLDRSAGMPLTLRNHQMAQLTSAGVRVLTAGRRFFARVDHALRTTLHGQGKGPSKLPRVLAIATSSPVIEDLVEDVATELDLLLAVSHAAADQVVMQFDAYRVDGVHTWWFGDPRIGVDRPVRVYPALDEPLWVWLPRSHPLADRRMVRLAELAGDRWVSEVGPGSQVAVRSVYRHAGLPAPAMVEVTSASVARGMLSRGEVVGLGSPLTPPLGSDAMVWRPVAERPVRTTGLLVDPSAMPATVVTHLVRAVVARYLEASARHHALVRTEPWWSQWYREQSARLQAPAPSPDERDGSADNVEELDVEELHLLRAVAEYGSINRAATALSISQPALTRRVHRLERRLGVQLLVRTSRGTTLTGPAKNFLDQLAALQAELCQASLTRHDVIPPRPRLCVGAPIGGARQARSRNL